MATKNDRSKREKTASAGDRALEEHLEADAQLGELEKVRSILFGDQARTYEKRISRLEERIREGLDAIRSEMLERHKELDELVQARSEELTRVIDDAQKTQGRQNQAFEDSLKATADSFKERAEQQEQRLQEVDASIREALKSESGDILNDLNQKIDSLSQALDRAVGKLSGDKLNRAHFAQLLSEMAKQIDRE